MAYDKVYCYINVSIARIDIDGLKLLPSIIVILCACECMSWRLQWRCGWQFCGSWVTFQSRTLLPLLKM